jgi:DNA-binding beta-propeller fold protein YncE
MKIPCVVAASFILLAVTTRQANAWSLAISPDQVDGVVLISSHESQHRILILRPDDKGPTYEFGHRGKGPGELLLPQAAVLDASRRIWVADTLNDRIQVFDNKGRVLKVLGSKGRKPGAFDKPLALTVVSGSNEIYVLDSGNARIQVLREDGRVRRVIAKSGYLSNARGIAVDAARNRLYVAEIGPARVSVFDSQTGEIITTLGKYGMADGEFLIPLHVAVDSEGAVYVSDDQTNRITKFNASGAYVTSWGGLGSEPGQLYHPQGLVFDDHDNLYVLDYGNRRGQIFDTNGRFQRVFAVGTVNSSRKFDLLPQ